MADAPAAGSSARPVTAALVAYEQANLARVTVVRTIVLLAILAWLFANYGVAIGLENVWTLGLFIVFGLAQYALVHDRPERRWVPYFFVVLDVALLGYTLLAPGRTYPESWPWATVLRQPSYLYALVFLALATLSFRPPLVVWTGCVITVCWSVGSALVLREPGSLITMRDLAGRDPDDPAFLARYLDPAYVHLDDALVRAFVTLVLTGILALAALRARQLVYREAEAARARTNLARYLAPSLVARMAATDRPLGAVRSQDVAVLVADMKGFSSLAASLDPVATMQLLRDFHGRLAEAVFAHQGTLDKFIGDGLMATFGTPETAADDAARAIACAMAMQAAIAAWNVERAARGLPPVALGIGLHHGRVTVGDIGGSGRFELAVIGDTVNTAFRIERQTRVLDRMLLVSEAVARAAGLDRDPAWQPLGAHVLRGHTTATTLWAPAADR